MKFIPEADSDFAFTAGGFVSRLRSDPAAHGVSVEQIAEIEKPVKDFRAALSARLVARVGGGGSPQMRMRKDTARAKAEEAVRRWAHIIRANPDVSDANKRLLRLKVRPKKLGKRKCPQSPPRLLFLGSGDGVAGGIAPGSGSGIHVLAFRDYNESVAITASCEVGRVRRAKPDGAVRVELYFDMIPVGEGGGLPKLPNERGWPKYLRSYTRSPMEVEFPVPSEPMLFVYWAKWADSTGETSRWSKPCVARVEGWTSTLPALPEGEAAAIDARRVETKYVFIQAPRQLPDLGGLEGDDVADEIAALGQRVLEVATQKMLNAA